MTPSNVSAAFRDPAITTAAICAAAATGVGMTLAPLPTAALLGVIVFLAATAVYAVRVAAHPDLLPGSVALGSLVLLRLPVLAGSTIASAAAILPFVAAGAMAGPRRLSLRTSTLTITGAYIALLTLELLRGAASGNYSSLTRAVGTALTLTAVAWFAFRFMGASKDAADTRRRMAQIALAPGVYALANAVLHLAGVTNSIELFSAAAGAPAEMLQTLGVSTTRVSFPLAVSINNFGVLCAAGLVASGALALRSTEFPRRYAIACAAACVYCLLRGDSRGPLLIGLSLLLFVALFGRIRLARGLAIVAPVSSLVVVAVLGFVASSPVGSGLASPGRDVATGSGRTEIWTETWSYLKQGQLQDVVGYGAAGQITSGVSRSYAYVFEGQERGDLVHAHNAFIQQVLDGGYIGALVLLSVFYAVLSGLARAPSDFDFAEATALLGAATALLLGGFTESVPSYLAPETLAVVILLLAAAAVKRTEATTDAATPPAVNERFGPRFG